MIKNLLLCLLIVEFYSLHFMLKEGEEKCIYDEIPKN